MAELQREYCRACRDEDRLTVAEFILWGKFFRREALGPRCYDHAAEWIDIFRVDQYAVYDLRPVNEYLAMTASTGGGSDV
jgi:hypothetical protein